MGGLACSDRNLAGFQESDGLGGACVVVGVLDTTDTASRPVLSAVWATAVDCSLDGVFDLAALRRASFARRARVPQARVHARQL
jgi:hypothetical protein